MRSLKWHGGALAGLEFYDMPIEDLCGQIRKVVSVVLDYPEKNEKLLYYLARGASCDDLDLILGHRAPAGEKRDPQPIQPQDDARAFAAAKGRILVQIRCSIKHPSGFAGSFGCSLPQ
jgi:hypothetical protein